MTATKSAALCVESLTHQYAPIAKSRRSNRGRGGSHSDQSKQRTQALNDVSFEVAQGEIFGILGPNGGGKTTLFRVLSTLLAPTQGDVSVFGHSIRTRPHDVRRHLGVVFQAPSLDGKLSARENLMHQGHLYGLRGEVLAQRIAQSLDQVRLSEKQDLHVEQFSGGMRRRVELAKALLHDPPLLLLDEPSTGLDVAGRRDLWQHLLELRKQRGVTVALTTHLMEEADQCDRLAVINHGKLVAIDTPSNLKARIGGDVITIEPLANRSVELAQRIADRFGPWDEGTEPAALNGRVFLEKSNGPAFVASLATAFPDEINSITVGQPSLEDVFMQLTGASLSPS